MQINPKVFSTCVEVSQIILGTFYGYKAKETTMEHPDSFSIYEVVREHCYFVAKLRSVRDEIVMHINLVPKGRQMEVDQKRWMKYAVKLYRWAWPATALAHEMDFAQMC